MTDPIVRQSIEILAEGSRSFRFASHFMPAARRNDAALLYAFCRLVDDLADDAPSPEVARADLAGVRAELFGEAEARPLLSAFLQMAARTGLDLRHADELIEGVLSDQDPVRVPDDRALVRYCYRVAGTVGLMMCPVLGVTAQEALPFALDLGVAMQLTNISRDVAEDARLGRVYLPADRLAAAGVMQAELLEGRVDRPEGVCAVVQDLLLLAEQYYRSASLGMRFIPWRPRMAILVASRVYREIGLKLLSRGADPMAGRTVVSGPRKAVVASSAIAQLARPSVLGLIRAPHTPQLHVHLRDLPGADVSGGPLRLGRPAQVNG